MGKDRGGHVLRRYDGHRLVKGHETDGGETLMAHWIALGIVLSLLTLGLCYYFGYQEGHKDGRNGSPSNP